MDDLIAFWRDRLDEREQLANAVEDNSAPWDGQWEAEGNHSVRTYNGHVLAYARTDNGRDGDFHPGLAAYIAASDPASVLADITADRAIIALCAQDVVDGRERDLEATEVLERVARIRVAKFASHPGSERGVEAMTITEFTEARLAEDEAALRKSRSAPDDANRFIDANQWDEELVSTFADEKRIEREIAAKRAILARHQHVIDNDMSDDLGARCLAEETLEELAAIWADHADYDDTWKPA